MKKTVTRAAASTNTREYYAAGGAMRVNGTLYFVMGDNLGSAVLTLDATGNTIGQEHYFPFGSMRFASGRMQTDRLFTGQRQMASLGIYDYGARFYSPYLSRWTQPDTIVPDPANPQTLGRYSYTLHNPIRYNDPSGHCVDPGDAPPGSAANRNLCVINPGDTTRDNNRRAGPDYQAFIQKRFGITSSGDWSQQNAAGLYTSLLRVDTYLNSRLKTFTEGTEIGFTFDPEHYGGITGNNGIQFHSFGALPAQNIYHEVFHLIDNKASGYFTNSLADYSILTVDGTYVMGGSPYQRNQYGSGYASATVCDPNFPNGIAAEQHSYCFENTEWCLDGNTAVEEWADLGANAVAGNFSNDPIGAVRGAWVANVFSCYFGIGSCIKP